jgi:metal-sulfur cluster biosynthetic enzyme
VAAIRERLLDVIDPDLGINVVDLGFVRGISVADGIAILIMTLTSPACPLTGVMEDQIRTELLDRAPLVDDFRIDWQWAPAWSPAEISADGREQLRAVGFNI